MPLHIHHRDERDGSVLETALPLAGEMPCEDFEGPSRFDWYYDTFVMAPRSLHDPEFQRLKRELADWLSTPSCMRDPYYVHEKAHQGHGGMGYDQLHVTILNPHDIAAFAQRWGTVFTLNPPSAPRNLQTDIGRIRRGHRPADSRLRAIYARYAALRPTLPAEAGTAQECALLEQILDERASLPAASPS